MGDRGRANEGGLLGLRLSGWGRVLPFAEVGHTIRGPDVGDLKLHFAHI